MKTVKKMTKKQEHRLHVAITRADDRCRRLLDKASRNMQDYDQFNKFINEAIELRAKLHDLRLKAGWED